jgi:hypothetical protein
MCDGNDLVTVRGVAAELPGETAVVASGNCQLTLVESSISAAVGIHASDDAKVTMEGGTLTGAQHAVDASGRAHVILLGVETTGRRRSSPGTRIQEKRRRR